MDLNYTLHQIHLTYIYRTIHSRAEYIYIYIYFLQAYTEDWKIHKYGKIKQGTPEQPVGQERYKKQPVSQEKYTKRNENYLETSINKNATYQMLWGKEKAILRGKFIATH